MHNDCKTQKNKIMSEFKYHYPRTNLNNIENHLKKTSQDLFEKYLEIKDSIISKLNKNYFAVFPNYNGNVADHANQAISFIDSWISDQMLFSLNALEIFLLLIGIHMHDIGMFAEHKEYDQSVHAKHFELGQQIVENSDWLNLSNTEKKIIGLIVRWHSYEKWILANSPIFCDIKIDKIVIRVTLLIHLMQISDFFHKIADLKWKNIN